MLDALIHAIPHEPWFAALGEALSEPERADMAAYLSALGFADIPAISARDWSEAGRIITDTGWEPRWWDAEEAQRAALLRRAFKLAGEKTVLETLTRVTQTAHDATIGAAAMASARVGAADPGLIRAAAGAATQACYQGALAMIAGAGDDHAFAVKLRLFRAGRWVLGIVRGTAYVL